MEARKILNSEVATVVIEAEGMMDSKVEAEVEEVQMEVREEEIQEEREDVKPNLIKI